MSLLHVPTGSRILCAKNYYSYAKTCTKTRMRTRCLLDGCGGPRRLSSSSTNASGGAAGRRATSSSSSAGMSDAQRRSYEFYERKRMESPLYRFRLWLNRNKKKRRPANNNNNTTIDPQDLNVQLAWYATAVVVGVVGATYASVPLYKVFCQTTGFGGTTQRVLVGGGDDNNNADPPTWIDKMMKSAIQQLPQSAVRRARVHTWTDEDAAARLSSLRPVANAELITVHFDTTIGDAIPWSFEATQPNVKVVPGETALSFFRVTNHSDKAITGVATYNVHPPKMGLYFQKIQCFCFEEQRILPGETVDMPVFYFIDPDMLKDPQVSYITDVTLSYTFFPTGEDDDHDTSDDKED